MKGGEEQKRPFEVCEAQRSNSPSFTFHNVSKKSICYFIFLEAPHNPVNCIRRLGFGERRYGVRRERVTWADRGSNQTNFSRFRASRGDFDIAIVATYVFSYKFKH